MPGSTNFCVPSSTGQMLWSRHSAMHCTPPWA
jgi:hypothetical protein